ncbi:MAG: sulfurtransferase [Nitrospirales bacterium]|nr:MAG: sulfurtransferase [Nitrospirales bacterium]
METLSKQHDLSFPEVSNDHLLNHKFTSRTNQIIVDVRTPGEFEEVHIPGSRNIPLTDLKSALPELVETAKNHELILACRTQNRVKLAYGQLVTHGISNCRILEGGVTQWIAEGKPVVRGKRGFSLEQQVRLSAGTVIVGGVVLSVLVSSWFLLIPAAAGIGLIHAGWTDSCLMGTMLATLPFNRKKMPTKEQPVLRNEYYKVGK